MGEGVPQREAFRELLSRKSGSENQVKRIMKQLFEGAQVSLELVSELYDTFLSELASPSTDLGSRMNLFNSVDFLLRNSGKKGDYEYVGYRTFLLRDLRRIIELLVDCERKGGEVWRLPRPEGLANIPRVLKFLHLWRSRDILSEMAFAPLDAFLRQWGEDASSMVPLSPDAIVKRMEDDRDAWKRARESTWMVRPPSSGAYSHPTPQASPRDLEEPGAQAEAEDPSLSQFRMGWEALVAEKRASAGPTGAAAVEATPSESPHLERVDEEERQLAQEEYACLARLEDALHLEQVLAWGEEEARRTGDTRVPLRPAPF